MRSVSDYIFCYGRKEFSVSKGGEGVFCFYDANKNLISTYNVYSQTGLTNIEIPKEAHYIRTSLSQRYSKTFTLAFSESSISYVKFGPLTTNTADKVSCKTVFSEVLASGGKIKLLGDSITQGVGGKNFAQDGETIVGSWQVNTNGYCWANLFKTYVESNYSNTVANYGTRGIRSYDIVSWLDSNNGYVTEDDKLLIVMIGTNNKWAMTNDTLEDLRDDIQWIIDWCADNDKRLILVSPPISTTKWDTEYSDGTPVKFHNADIDNVYKQICSKNNIDYISMYQKMDQYCSSHSVNLDSIFSDGLHPNNTGYELMYNILMDELQ